MLPLGIIPTIITLPVLADVLTGCGHPRLGHPSQENYQDAIFLATESQIHGTEIPVPNLGSGHHGQNIRAMD